MNSRVATELGRIDRSGLPIAHGEITVDEEFMGQPYLVDAKTGEGHYRSEWLEIRVYYARKALEELGHNVEEGTMYGPWHMYHNGRWCWVGP